jgi:hypothetical protein
MVKVSQLVRDHKAGIIASVELGLSNSRLEGTNSKIRLLNHRGYGHHRANTFIPIIYLACAGITTPPVGTPTAPDTTPTDGLRAVSDQPREPACEPTGEKPRTQPPHQPTTTPPGGPRQPEPAAPDPAGRPTGRPPPSPPQARPPAVRSAQPSHRDDPCEPVSPITETTGEPTALTEDAGSGVSPRGRIHHHQNRGPNCGDLP